MATTEGPAAAGSVQASSYEAFTIEQHGIDLIPEEERQLKHSAGLLRQAIDELKL